MARKLPDAASPLLTRSNTTPAIPHHQTAPLMSRSTSLIYRRFASSRIEEEIDEDALSLDLGRVMSSSDGPFAGPSVLKSLRTRSSPDAAIARRNPSYGTLPPIEDNEDESHFINISKRRFWFVFSGILFGYLIVFFDATLMASSHPVITSYFHASNSASWLTTVFFLTSTVFQPMFGRISDTIGRRPLHLFSIVIFCATTAWCALANNIESFILARAFCGLGAGGVASLGMIITADVVKVEYRGIYQSYINIVSGLMEVSDTRRSLVESTSCQPVLTCLNVGFWMRQ